jgi:hypothetical protein
VAEPKNAKMHAPKLNFKAQNSHIKPVMKYEKTFYKPCFETAYLGENFIKNA